MQAKHWIEFLVDGKWIFEHDLNQSKTLLSRIETISKDLVNLIRELEEHEKLLLNDVLKQYTQDEILEAKNKAETFKNEKNQTNLKY